MRPLEGIKVLDLSRLIPGPFATMVLADLGATVDKIEDPGGGDYLRHMPPQVDGESPAFRLLNRGKRSAVLDLKKPDAREALRAMATKYDVLFDQFRPGVLARLGLAHEELVRENPRLVICALTGYGQTGELAARAGHDLNYLARAGVLGAQGPSDAPPQVPGFQLADISGGMWSVIAILAALRERDRTGRGAVLDVAMTDGLLGFFSIELASALAGAMQPRGAATLTGGIAPYKTYFAKDGAPMTLASLEPKFWLAFCAGVGIEGDLSALVPGPHQAAMQAKIAEVFASKTRDEWMAFAREHDACVEPALSPSELTSDAHLTSRQLFFDVGGFSHFRTPVTPKDSAPRPAPKSGEHTRDILREAGLTDDAIDRLFASGAAR